MSSLKVGRNQLCPCGSGKKYKKCCGKLVDIVDIHDDIFTRNSKLITAVKLKLDKYYSATIRKIRKDAKIQFLRFTVNNSLPEEHESIYSDWVWFDRLADDNNTIAGHFLSENAAYMDISLKGCLEALNSSYLSVYEAEEIRDNYLSVRDIFLNDTCEILLKEPWEGVDKDTNLLLLGRKVAVGDNNIFSGMVLIVENNVGQKDFVIEHMNYVRKTLNITIENVLKRHAEILYGVFDHAYYKTMINFNEISGLELTSEEQTIVTNKIAENEDFVLLHQSEGFSWYKPVYQHQGYVRMVLGKGELFYYADILEDMLYLQNKIAAFQPGKELSVYSNRFLQQPPLPAKSDLWFMIIKDRETEKWMDTELKELEGKTPRDFLDSTKDKAHLLSILDQLSRIISDDQLNLIKYIKERVSNYNI